MLRQQYGSSKIVKPLRQDPLFVKTSVKPIEMPAGYCGHFFIGLLIASAAHQEIAIHRQIVTGRNLSSD
jgi:hypothetical protein